MIQSKSGMFEQDITESTTIVVQDLLRQNYGKYMKRSREFFLIAAKERKLRNRQIIIVAYFVIPYKISLF